MSLKLNNYIGTSVILKHQNGLLFEIQKPEKWQKKKGGLTIGLGCIGGHREPGETPTETILREAQEEIGCAIDLQTMPKTFFYFNGKIKRCASSDLPEGAWFAWEDLQPGFTPGIKVAVFFGILKGAPSPGDLPATLTLPVNALSSINGCTLHQALHQGGTLIESRFIPRTARLKLTNTPRILVDILYKSPDLLSL